MSEDWKACTALRAREERGELLNGVRLLSARFGQRLTTEGDISTKLN